MRTRLVAATLALLLAGCVFEAPVSEPSFPVDYPIRHYVFKEDGADMAAWKAEVREFRETLRKRYGVEVSTPRLLSDSKEVEYLDRAVDPKEIIWRDPRRCFTTPLLLSWWEVIDERGRVEHVYVVASNQPKEVDARVLAWCVNDKLWKAGELEGSPTTTIRTASINLGESRYHVHYWQKKLTPLNVTVLTLVAIAILVWLVARGVRRRRDARERHEALLRHTAHKPFTPPSIDEPPRL
jgi:hypothetical protein